jgi:guanylate kinase
VHGRHYWFVTDAEFDRMVAADELLEWAVVHRSAKYGTPRRPVAEALAAGRPALLEIDLQGARQVRQSMPDALFVFLKPPSWEELVRRLVGRGTETPEERDRRLDTARAELAAETEFDATVVNSEVPRAAEELVALMQGA